MKRLAILVLALGGCGGDDDAKLIAAALQFVAPGATCFKDHTLPDKQNTEGFASGGVWTMFHGADDQFFLAVEGSMDFDMANAADVSVTGVFEGKRDANDSNKYTFSGRAIEVNKPGGQTFTITTTREVLFNLVVGEGDSVTGSLTVISSRSCGPTGDPECTNDYDKKNPSCSITYPLKGSVQQLNQLVSD